jgi:predicted DCC family thiol-disulfide oxidoreductase YuxK
MNSGIARDDAGLVYPASHLVIYDGACEFCSHSAWFVFRHDRKQLFKFCPIQSAFGRRVYETLGLNPEDPESLVVIVEGRIYTRSDAVLEIAITFGGVWRVAALLRRVPRGLRDWIYRFVARHRRWIPGGKATCLLDPAFKSRLIE